MIRGLVFGWWKGRRRSSRVRRREGGEVVVERDEEGEEGEDRLNGGCGWPMVKWERVLHVFESLSRRIRWRRLDWEI